MPPLMVQRIRLHRNAWTVRVRVVWSWKWVQTHLYGFTCNCLSTIAQSCFDSIPMYEWSFNPLGEWWEVEAGDNREGWAATGDAQAALLTWTGAEWSDTRERQGERKRSSNGHGNGETSEYTERERKPYTGTRCVCVRVRFIYIII